MEEEKKFKLIAIIHHNDLNTVEELGIRVERTEHENSILYDKMTEKMPRLLAYIESERSSDELSKELKKNKIEHIIINDEDICAVYCVLESLKSLSVEIDLLTKHDMEIDIDAVQMSVAPVVFLIRFYCQENRLKVLLDRFYKYYISSLD